MSLMKTSAVISLQGKHSTYIVSEKHEIIKIIFITEGPLHNIQCKLQNDATLLGTHFTHYQ